jgi:hypothetical protein
LARHVGDALPEFVQPCVCVCGASGRQVRSGPNPSERVRCLDPNPKPDCGITRLYSIPQAAIRLTTTAGRGPRRRICGAFASSNPEVRPLALRKLLISSEQGLAPMVHGAHDAARLSTYSTTMCFGGLLEPLPTPGAVFPRYPWQGKHIAHPHTPQKHKQNTHRHITTPPDTP